MEVSTSTTQSTSKTPIDNKKKYIIAGILLLVIGIIGIFAAVLVFNSQNKPNPNSDNNPGGFTYLSENTCPQSIFEENGVMRADVEGKPYLVHEGSLSWIRSNCQNVSGLTSDNNNNTNSNGNSNQASNETEPPLKLGSIGFNLADFNPATNTAGDIVFTKTPLPFNEIYGPFGQQDPRSPNDPTKKNPQPTVILPLGTKVHSLVTGVVVEVKELYSGDMTIWVAKDKTSQYFYETEHIINPTVSVGDTVTAGQIIGEVSDYDSHNNPGFGLIEIGILHPTPGGGVPEHVCPLKYLDESIKSTIEGQLTKLYAAW
ncbi:MAG: M23 family metallopeptidase, partial [Candidatus Dojkabacteria bacterium]